MNIGPHRDFGPRPNSSPLPNSYVPLGFLAQQQKPQITEGQQEANICANNNCEQTTAAATAENGQQQNTNSNNNGQPRSILKNSSVDNTGTAQRATTNKMMNNNNNNTTTGDSNNNNANNNNRKMPAKTLASSVSNQQLAQRRRMEAQKTVAFSSTINVNETAIGKDVKGGGAGLIGKNTKKIVIFSHEALALRDLFNEMKSELEAKIEALSRKNDNFRREQRDLVDMIETLLNRLHAQDEQVTKLSSQLKRLKNNGLEQQRQFGTPLSPALDNPIDDDSDNNDVDVNTSPANSPVFLMSYHRDNLNKSSIERNCNNEGIRHGTGTGREMRLAKVNRHAVNNTNDNNNNNKLSDVRMNIIMHKLKKVLQRPGGFERVEKFADIWAVPSGGILQVRSLGPDACSSIISGEGSRTIRRSVVYQQEKIHHSPARQLLRQLRDRKQIKPRGEMSQQPELPTGRQNQQQRSCWQTNRNNRRQAQKPMISDDPPSEEEKENHQRQPQRRRQHQIEEVPYGRKNNNNNNNNYRRSDPCTDDKYFQEDNNNDNSNDSDSANNNI